MSTATLAELAASAPAAGDSDLNHYYCCDPNVALCGTDISAMPETDEDIDCVVCADLEPTMAYTPCASPACPNRGAA